MAVGVPYLQAHYTKSGCIAKEIENSAGMWNGDRLRPRNWRSNICLTMGFSVIQEAAKKERREKEMAAKVERLAALKAAREERARNLKLMPKGAAIVED